jgi:hypothetical protein
MFCLPPSIAIAVLGINIWYQYHSTLSQIHTIGAYNTLLMGDSQIQRINPENFTSSTYNFASMGEHYYFTYNKLKLITDFKDSNLKQVVVGFSPHNLAPVFCKLFDHSTPEGSKSLRRYFYFIRGSAFITIEERFEIVNLRNLFHAKTDWGGYFKSSYSNPDTFNINKTLEMHFGGNTYGVCESQIEYLNKIIELCKAKKINLVLLTTPYHPYYRIRLDNGYLTTYKDLLAKYDDLTIINYLDDEIDPDWMSDANHLNVKGSEYYSKNINAIIENLKRSTFEDDKIKARNLGD